MPQSRAKPAGNSLCPDTCRDQIEQKIIRAYVQLAVTPDRTRPRTVTLARFGALEVRLTEIHQAGALPIVPSYRLEMYSCAIGSTIDSFECIEFDEGELAAAVEFVCRAKQRHRALN